MKYTFVVLAAIMTGLAFTQGVTAQSYMPTPPVVKPNVLPKPVANRLIKRPTAEQTKGAENADNAEK